MTFFFFHHTVQPPINGYIQGLFMKEMASDWTVIVERVSKIKVAILAPALKIGNSDSLVSPNQVFPIL